MKSLIFCCILFCLATHQVAAQHSGRKHVLTENSTVKDTAGKVYPFIIWSNMLNSGDYGWYPLNPQAEVTDFVIYKLTEQQKKQRMEMMKPAESKYFRTGKTLSSFKTTDIDGNPINLKELKGKVVVINFWFINCAPCRKEIPELNQLVNDYKDSSDIVFIAIALDEKSALKEFLAKSPFNYSIIDNGQFIASKYSVNSYPTHVILDKEGKVTFHTSGYGMSTTYWIRKEIEKARTSQLIN